MWRVGSVGTLVVVALALAGCGRTKELKAVRVGPACKAPFGVWMKVKEHRKWLWSKAPDKLEVILPSGGTATVARACLSESVPSGESFFVVAGGTPARDGPDPDALEIGRLRGAAPVLLAPSEGEWALAVQDGLPRGFVSRQAVRAEAPPPEDSLRLALQTAAKDRALAKAMATEVAAEDRAGGTLQRMACAVAVAIEEDLPGGPTLAECESLPGGFAMKADDLCQFAFGRSCAKHKGVKKCDRDCLDLARREMARKVRLRCWAGSDWVDHESVRTVPGPLDAVGDELSVWLCPPGEVEGTRPGRGWVEVLAADWRGNTTSLGNVELPHVESGCPGEYALKALQVVGSGACLDVAWTDAGCPSAKGESARGLVCVSTPERPGAEPELLEISLGGTSVMRSPVEEEQCAAGTAPTQTQNGPDSQRIEYKAGATEDASPCYEVTTTVRPEGEHQPGRIGLEPVLCVRNAARGDSRADAVVALRPGKAAFQEVWPTSCGPRAAATLLQPKAAGEPAEAAPGGAEGQAAAGE